MTTTITRKEPRIEWDFYDKETLKLKEKNKKMTNSQAIEKAGKNGLLCSLSLIREF